MRQSYITPATTTIRIAAGQLLAGSYDSLPSSPPGGTPGIKSARGARASSQWEDEEEDY